MHQKELRIALVCYGGVSLAVYMHGVTKELWHLARASRAHNTGEKIGGGVGKVYQDLLEHVELHRGMRLRVIPDILSGASAGGINAVFLSQALYAGHSLEPLTDLWLKNADVEKLLDPDARPVWRFAKFWAQPIAWWLFTRPGNAVSESVAPETRSEVRRKVSRFIRSRWFQPPFSGDNFSKLLFDALEAMHNEPPGPPLLPPYHPLDLFVTSTDFRGHRVMLRLNSPPVVEESEHRLPIHFRGQTPTQSGMGLADPLELTFAARATASFPGAFPPLELSEIDRLAAKRGREWPTRSDFLHRIMPVRMRRGEAEKVALIDGSVLVNAPFEGAISALHGRPSHREVDRRFVYIDPRPDRVAVMNDPDPKPVGFFSALFGSISILPREQPIRDNLEHLQRQSRDAARLQQTLAGLRPEVDREVEKLFGWTFFLDRPTPKRLHAWRAKAQQAAAENSGYAFHSYAHVKFTGIVERLARLVHEAVPELDQPDPSAIEAALREELLKRGLHELSDPKAGASTAAIAFFRAHDIGFRIRRLRLLAQRLSRDWERDPNIPDVALDPARNEIYLILSHYYERDTLAALGSEFPAVARRVFDDPGAVLDYMANTRLLPEVDDAAEDRLADALARMPKPLRRRMLLGYLGFPYYDVATLPILQQEGVIEYDPIKVDRISPVDAQSIREGGARATLRGIEFYSFGAFFSRAYRENDYLWGRLHGAERMIDLVCSTIGVGTGIAEHDCASFKRATFEAIIEEELAAGRCSRKLLEGLREEIAARFTSRL
ncbi:MAG TPA: patatin-like protein [Erythrobacter sp.]|nr:patatin-like protein [Erythrobacter sp.]